MANRVPIFEPQEHAFREYLHSYKMEVPPGFITDDIDVFHNSITPELLRVIEESVNNLGPIKISYTMQVLLVMPIGDELQTKHFFFRRGEPLVINNFDPEHIRELLRGVADGMNEELARMVENGSGWIVDRVNKVYLDVARYVPIRGGSYIPLPPKLKAKQAIINIKNWDDECLRWSIRAALFPTDLPHPERTSRYPTADGLDFTGISFPTPLNQIKRVERQNGLSINVLTCVRGKVTPIYCSAMGARDQNGNDIREINLMYIKEGGRTHYCLIKNLGRLLRDQHGTRNQVYYCTRCLYGFSSERVLTNHRVYCNGSLGRPARIEMPEKGKNTLTFKNYQRQMKKPFIIYADCESLIEKTGEVIPPANRSSTTKTEIQKPSGFAFIAVKSDRTVFKEWLFSGENSVVGFLNALQEVEREIREELSNPVPLKKEEMTRKNWAHFNNTKDCHICHESLVKENHMDVVEYFHPQTGEYFGKVHAKTNKCYYTCLRQATTDDDGNCIIEKWAPRKPKPEGLVEDDNCCYCGEPQLRRSFRDAVLDHCHITGKYRGPAHRACNRSYFRINPQKEIIPVVFHNLRGYDAHHIMQRIGEVAPDLKCIANNMEKYISFTMGGLRFIDSMQFMPNSLEQLAASTKPDDLKIMMQFEGDPYRRSLLTRKGVFPYEHMDSFERFNEESLPPKEAFYSKLKMEGITDEDYEHAQRVWESRECNTLQDYHDLYLATDTVILADIFENFRETCLKHYGLDPAHYYTSPGLSWDALLKKTGVKLELLTDYDMHLFIEQGTRGGISTEMKRFSKANNPYLAGYDPEKESVYIIYLDANNQYGWAMSQPLPVGDFRWTRRMPTEKQIMSWRPDRKRGFILEVDLEYPQELHDKHNSYPLAPEASQVPQEWFSPYQRGIAEELELGKDTTKKLLLTLKDKKRYVLHYRNLQQYLHLGMKLTGVHRCLSFNQEPWMKSYIDMNTELRKKATSDFEKNFFKLMNNSVFGKTMENLRNRTDIKLVRQGDGDKIRKLTSNPLYSHYAIFSNSLAGIKMHKDSITLNRPVYTGMCVLDLSKTLLYDFYYNRLHEIYGDRCQVIYTDTDSLLLEIKTEDVYKDMSYNMCHYDTSDFPKDHFLHSQANKKVLGKMKDECAGKPISEVVCLRSKMYSILLDDEKNIKKAKGTKKTVTSKVLKHENYKEALFNRKAFKHGMDMLRSENHQIYGVHLNKVTLSPFDSKRWIKDDGVHTLAYGHKDINPQE